MLKKFMFGVTIMTSIVLSASFAEHSHLPSDPLYHDNLSAEATTKITGIIKLKYQALAIVEAPSNADGNYDVFAKVEGDIGENHKSGYIGGVRAVAESSVKIYIWSAQPNPNMAAKAKIDGNFLVGSPGKIIIHTENPADHEIQKP